MNIDGVMDYICEEALKNEDDPSREITPASRWPGARHAEKPELRKKASPI